MQAQAAAPKAFGAADKFVQKLCRQFVYSFLFKIGSRLEAQASDRELSSPSSSRRKRDDSHGA